MARLTMLLAFGPDQPSGNLKDRLEVRMPLTGQGWLDPVAHAADPEGWPARRVLPDGSAVDCNLVRTSAGWALQRPGHEDDPLWTLEGRVFRPGDYVTLRDQEAAEFVFRIVGVAAD